VKKTILVTGGAGFIGSNFVHHLWNKYPDYKILVLDLLTYAGNPENFPVQGSGHPRFEFWYGDVCNAELAAITSSILPPKVMSLVRFMIITPFIEQMSWEPIQLQMQF